MHNAYTQCLPGNGVLTAGEGMALRVGGIEGEGGAGALRFLAGGADELGAHLVSGIAPGVGDALDQGVEALGRGLPAGWYGEAGPGEQCLRVADHSIELTLRQPLRAPKIRNVRRRRP